MKKYCIVSLLDARHHNILNQYLSTHEPVSIVTPEWMITETLVKNAHLYNCTVVSLEQFLPENYNAAIPAQKVFDEAISVLSSINWQKDFPLETDTANLTRIISSFLANSLTTRVLRIDALEYMKELLVPLVVLVSEDYTWASKQAVVWAKANNVPSIHLLHGIFYGEASTVHKGLTADVAATFGEHSNRILIEQDIELHRLHVTGNPLWDNHKSWRNNKKKSKIQIRLKYKIDLTKKTIVFGTTWINQLTAHEEQNVYIRTLYLFLKSCKELLDKGLDFNIIIKDRMQNKALSEKVVSESLEALNIEKNCVLTFTDTELLVSAADILVGVTSNYLIEAMLVDTLAVNLLDECNLFLGTSFEADSGVRLAESYNLTDILYTLLTDENEVENQLKQQRVTLDKFNVTHESGLGQKNLSDLICKMTNNKLPKSKG